MPSTPHSTTPIPVAPTRPGAPPSLARRLRSTAAAVAALAVVAGLAVAAVSAGASPSTDESAVDHTDHAAMGSPLADDPPPLPAPSEMVGVLDLFGRPLLGPDGQPLQVPLRPPSPRVPSNAGEVYVPDGSPLTEATAEVDLLTAHAVTLNEVANDEGYDLVQRFDLFRANGLVTSTTGQSDGAETYRAMLAQLDDQVSTGDGPSACATAALALDQSDGVPTDLVTGLAVGQLHAEVLLIRQSLPCP